MKIAGIIAEYNPFHSGHARHISLTREKADIIVVALSGNFVQRGEPALCDKGLRASMAMESGADLVLELPVAWSMASAERFAMGGARILAAAGVNMLSFGCEAASAEPLREAAHALAGEAFELRLREALKSGVSYPRAFAIAAGPYAGLLAFPNNALGIEYIRAFERLEHPVELLGIPRTVPHDSASAEGKYASASLLRSLLETEGTASVRSYMPQAAWNLLCEAFEKETAPASATRLERAVLAALRTTTAAGFAALPDVSEGLENRLVKAAAAESLEAFYSSAKSKRVIHARLRRIAWAALLDMHPAQLPALPPYLRPLALNYKGAALLNQVAEGSMPLPVYTKAVSIPQTGEAAEVFALECRATDCFALSTPTIQPGGMEFLRSPLFFSGSKQ